MLKTLLAEVIQCSGVTGPERLQHSLLNPELCDIEIVKHNKAPKSNKQIRVWTVWTLRVLSGRTLTSSKHKTQSKLYFDVKGPKERILVRDILHFCHSCHSLEKETLKPLCLSPILAALKFASLNKNGPNGHKKKLWAFILSAC